MTGRATSDLLRGSEYRRKVDVLSELERLSHDQLALTVAQLAIANPGLQVAIYRGLAPQRAWISSDMRRRVALRANDDLAYRHACWLLVGEHDGAGDVVRR
jgi:hypothetical protein